MGLPKPIRPEYNTTVPSTGKKIKYMPFTVREEKVLILAAESEMPDEISNGVANCLRNCITSPTDFDVDSLALFDIEYLFLKCRAKSVSEKITVNVSDPDDETFRTPVEISIDKIGIFRDPEHKELIEISDDMSLSLRYPDLSFFAEGVSLDDIDGVIGVICRTFKQLIVGEEVFNRDDLTDDEIREWIESLSSEQFQKINQFYSTMPRLKHEIKAKNTKTGKPFTVTLEGLSDFF